MQNKGVRYLAVQDGDQPEPQRAGFQEPDIRQGGAVSKYHAGRSLEYEVKSLFHAAGWESIRGAGSKGSVDGFKTDLVFSKKSAHNEKLIYLVLMQAKRKGIKSQRDTNGTISPQEAT